MVRYIGFLYGRQECVFVMVLDVLVVGASPAGLSAAREAADSGVKVLLLDRKTDWQEHHPANTFFESMWRRTGLPLPSKCVTHRLDGMQLVSPGGHELEIDMKGYAFDRPEFDRWLAGRVQTAGGEIRLGCEATGLLRGKGEAVCGVLVPATGLRPTWHPEDVAWAREALCVAPGAGDAARFRYYLGSCSPGWKATFSPVGGDIIGIGVYVRRHGTDVTSFFDKHMRRVAEELGETPRVIQTWGGGDPIFTVPRWLVADGLALAGGCAGQSGIAFGIVAGQIAGRVAAGAAVEGNAEAARLAGYPGEWKKALGADYRRGRFARELVRRLSDDELDRVAGLFEGQNNTELAGKSMSGMAMEVIKTCLKRDPGALGLLGVFIRR